MKKQNIKSSKKYVAISNPAMLAFIFLILFLKISLSFLFTAFHQFLIYNPFNLCHIFNHFNLFTSTSIFCPFKTRKGFLNYPVTFVTPLHWMEYRFSESEYLLGYINLNQDFVPLAYYHNIENLTIEWFRAISVPWVCIDVQ